MGGGVPEPPLLQILRTLSNGPVLLQTSPSPVPQPSLRLPLACSYGLLSLAEFFLSLWDLAGPAGGVWEGTTNKMDKRASREGLPETPGVLSGDCVPGSAPSPCQRQAQSGAGAVSFPLKEGERLLPQQKSFLFHSPVLKPDLDLLVTKIQAV